MDNCEGENMSERNWTHASDEEFDLAAKWADASDEEFDLAAQVILTSGKAHLPLAGLTFWEFELLRRYLARGERIERQRKAMKSAVSCNALCERCRRKLRAELERKS